ncbi:MAG: ABC transporter ATP-binding protein [Burkholderiaceae bacterium]
MALLELQNLHKRFGALVVTDDLSLAIEAGELVGVLGPNGAGKTTLFHLITGTLQADGGRIAFDGRDVTRLDASARCRAGIARSFQVPHPFAGMTVYENILVGATFGRGRGHGNPQRRAYEVMCLTGMEERANVQAGNLTLLERKRLEMARALAADPRLLLLDEIAGGLTDRECVSLLETIREIHTSGVTIVWIEHVVHALLSIAQRLIVMDFGRLVIDGEPAAVMASPEVQAIYMGESALD